jgi:predicted DCC family thiol-disulfide oxidoreductase YuxK
MDTDSALFIIYDGDCPFCSAYAKMLRLRETFGAVQLISARSDDPVIQEIQKQGIQTDKGIVVKWQGSFLQADEAMHFLAMASTSSSLLLKINQWLFRSPQFTNRIYPYLYAARNLSLILLGRKRLIAHQPTDVTHNNHA